MRNFQGRFVIPSLDGEVFFWKRKGFVFVVNKGGE
jgi:hypothetical protein